MSNVAVDIEYNKHCRAKANFNADSTHKPDWLALQPKPKPVTGLYIGEQGVNASASGPTPSHHVKVAVYADDAGALSTSRKSALFLSYLECFLSDLERWLREWRIAINVSKCTAIFFSSRRIQNPRPALLFGEPIIWVDRTRYLGVAFDKRLT
jgi:hypothetical protein